VAANGFTLTAFAGRLSHQPGQLCACVFEGHAHLLALRLLLGPTLLGEPAPVCGFAVIARSEYVFHTSSDPCPSSGTMPDPLQVGQSLSSSVP
jgi:hypothetical protein